MPVYEEKVDQGEKGEEEQSFPMKHLQGTSCIALHCTFGVVLTEAVHTLPFKMTVRVQDRQR